jgi:hypothetical protein
MGRRNGIPALAVALLALSTAAPAAAQTGFANEGSYAVGFNPYGVVARDFNADRRPDVAVINGTSSTMSVYLRQAGGGFTQEQGSPFGVGAGPNYAVADDFAGDSLPDVAFASFNQSYVGILRRLSGGGFQTEDIALATFGRAT